MTVEVVSYSVLVSVTVEVDVGIVTVESSPAVIVGPGSPPDSVKSGPAKPTSRFCFAAAVGHGGGGGGVGQVYFVFVKIIVVCGL